VIDCESRFNSKICESRSNHEKATINRRTTLVANPSGNRRKVIDCQSNPIAFNPSKTDRYWTLRPFSICSLTRPNIDVEIKRTVPDNQKMDLITIGDWFDLHDETRQKSRLSVLMTMLEVVITRVCSKRAKKSRDWRSIKLWTRRRIRLWACPTFGTEIEQISSANRRKFDRN
jgi:hypothetical protein